MWTNVAISASTPMQRTLSRGHAANPSSHRLHLTMGQWRRIDIATGHIMNMNMKMYAEGGDAATGTETESDTEVMSMVDSLIERAQEVAASGLVDDEFKASFVEELKKEFESLQQKAASAEKSAIAFEDTLKSTKDQFVRLTADFENFRKRTQTEQETLKNSVKGNTLVELLPLIDNFELAKQQLKIETEGEQKIDNAYQGLYKQMVELFRGLGLEAVPGVGSPFDPEVHEAIMREHSDEFEEGAVMEEFRKGFQLGDRLLRPAMVKVAYNENASPSASDEAPMGNSDEE